MGLASTAKKECGHIRKLVIVLRDKFAKCSYLRVKIKAVIGVVNVGQGFRQSLSYQ